MPKSVVVTGGMGFVGANIALKFIEEGYQTILYDIAQNDIDFLEAWKEQWRFAQGGVDDWRKLVEIAARETMLSSIEPLEPPPMGDCDLRELKRHFGHKMAFKGNLNTTDVMLYGSVERVEQACKQAIDDAAEGGGFVLSTGDQAPRDAPDANIIAMQRVAETYGKY